MYPVAWAYLRPLGKARIHMSRSRLQLYRFKFNFSKDIKKKRPFDHRTPEVFMDYNWYRSRHEKYPSFLEVDLSFVRKSEHTIVRNHFSRAPWEKEVGDKWEPKMNEIDPDPKPIPNPVPDFALKRWEKFLD